MQKCFFFLIGVIFLSQFSMGAEPKAATANKSSFTADDCSNTANVEIKPNDTQTAVYYIRVAEGMQPCAKATQGTTAFSGDVLALPINELLKSACSNDAQKKKPTTVQICFLNKDGEPISQALLSYKGQGGGNANAIANIDDFELVPGDGTITIRVPEGPTEVCFAPTRDAVLKDKTADCETTQPFEDQGPEIQLGSGDITAGVTYDVKVRKKGDKTYTAIKRAASFNSFSALQAWDVAPNPWAIGCSANPLAVGQGWSGLLLLWGLALWVRKRRQNKVMRMNKLGIGILVMLLPTMSHAYLGQWSFGIRGAPYLPNLDASTTSEGTLAKPLYGCMFNNRVLPLIGIDNDLHLWDGFGSVRVGTGIEYTFSSGNALYNPNVNICSKIESLKTNLHFLFLKPYITYVLNPFFDTIPLAPFVRAGLVGAGYYFVYQGQPDTRGQSDIAESSLKPLGVRLGYELTAGLYFGLNWLDPELAARSESEELYREIYLTFSASYAVIDQFGKPGFNFSPRTWSYPIKFDIGVGIEMP